jgi:hypothetical protein
VISDLARRVGRALDYAEAAIALVRAESPGVDLDALEAPPQKIIAETAMLLRVAAEVPATVAPGVAERAHELIRALLPHARHHRVTVGIALRPALAVDYAAPHLVLGKAGYPDPEFDRALAEARAAPSARARERLPHRELEQAWLASLSGGPAPESELVARTALCGGIDLLTGSRDDVYAFTHAVMYATDFGHYRVRAAGSAADALATAGGAIAGALDDDDFDLAGELLLTWPCLGAGWSTISSLAFSVLARVEDEVGVLPSLAIDRAGYDRQPAASRRHYVAAVTYHTAYVMGMLCGLILRSRRLPHSSLPAAPGSTERADELLLRLADARPPQWYRQVQALPPDRRGSCLSFLLDVALRRAVRRLDLEAVKQLLCFGVDSGVTLSPVCAQAAGMLRRLARCSGFVAAAAPTSLATSEFLGFSPQSRRVAGEEIHEHAQLPRATAVVQPGE